MLGDETRHNEKLTLDELRASNLNDRERQYKVFEYTTGYLLFCLVRGRLDKLVRVNNVLTALYIIPDVLPGGGQIIEGLAVVRGFHEASLDEGPDKGIQHHVSVNLRYKSQKSNAKRKLKPQLAMFSLPDEVALSEYFRGGMKSQRPSFPRLAEIEFQNFDKPYISCKITNTFLASARGNINAGMLNGRPYTKNWFGCYRLQNPNRAVTDEKPLVHHFASFTHAPVQKKERLLHDTDSEDESLSYSDQIQRALDLEESERTVRKPQTSNPERLRNSESEQPLLGCSL